MFNVHIYFVKFSRCFLAVLVLCLLSALFSSASLAESKQVRIALVIGNSVYANAVERLPGTSEDAERVTKALKEKLGFKVTKRENLNRQEMDRELKQFKKDVANAGSNAIGMFYYAGHRGADRELKDNFLIPVDSHGINATDIWEKGISVRSIQNELQELPQKGVYPAAIFVVIDACRTPSKRSDSNPPNSAMTMTAEPEQGYLFAFSTSKNQTASDSERVFAEALIKHMLRKGLTIPQVFEEVQREVWSRINQFPIYQSSIAAPICLMSCETDTKGAFRQNEVLLETTRKDAEAGFKRIEALQAAARCKRGWNSVVALHTSAEKHWKSGNLDTAGETYKEVAQRAAEIEGYLTSADIVANTVAEAKKKLDEANTSLQKTYAEGAKSAYSSKRWWFEHQISILESGAAQLKRRVDWTEVRRIDARAESLAKSDRYEDATNEMVDGFNLLTKMIASMTGSRPDPPIAKLPRRETVLPSPLSQVNTPPVMPGSVCN